MLQKSRKITILMLAILAIFSIVANKVLLFDQHTLNYIVNPIFWVIYTIACCFLLSKVEEKMRFKGDTIISSLIASAVYIGIYVISMFLLENGENPFSHSFKGLIINAYVYILPIVAREYARFRLINNVYEKDKKFISVITTVIFIGVSIGMVDISAKQELSKTIFSQIIPIIAENILFSYIAYNRMFLPCIIYKVFTFSFWLFMPVLPKVFWIMSFVIDTTIPLILLLYVRYFLKKREVKKDKKELETVNPKDYIPLIIISITAFWFALGLFPVKPAAILTGSMEKTIMVGDMVILKKCDANEIEVGDIVQYSKDNYTVVHRVISKYYEKGELFFITKGDNNNTEDFDPVSANQIIAKELFSIRFLGYPSLLINKLVNQSDVVSVETGR